MGPPFVELELESLFERAECLTHAAAEHMSEACVVMMDSHGHLSGVVMDVNQDEKSYDVSISWEIRLSDRMRRGNRDLNKTVDNAACAVALLLVSGLTDYCGFEQSATGDRIDYYLRSKSGDDTLIFNDTMKMEVSGIAQETSGNTLSNRVKQKRTRLDSIGGPGSSSGTTFVCVVEFSHPKSEMVLV